MTIMGQQSRTMPVKGLAMEQVGQLYAAGPQAGADHHALQRDGRCTLLHAAGAPPLLGYALACSVAWHTRRPTVLLVVGDGALPLSLLTRRLGAAASVGTALPGAHIVQMPGRTGGLSAALPALVADLCQRYDDVLVQLDRAEPAPMVAARTLYLTGQDGAGAGTPAPGPGPTLRAWTTGTGARRPDQTGVVQVPALEWTDEQALCRGILPARTPAGRALGWVARDLAHLQVGLALGCGGTKGYAHIGVWRALERMGLTADMVAGTSIGAAVAALYATNCDPDGAATVLDRVGAAAWRVALPTRALLSSAGLRDRLRQVSGEQRIEALDRPLAVVAADIASWQEVVFRRGLVRTAVLASMAIPGIYPPVRMGSYTLVDGSVLNPVPADVAAAMGADIVLAVTLASRPAPRMVVAEASEVDGAPPSLLPVIMQSVALMQGKITPPLVGAATIAIAPAVSDGVGPGLRRFPQGRQYMAAGECAAEAARPRLAAALPWLRA